MRTSLVITVLATDRPGLVSELSEVLRTHDANWMESRFAQLAGKFAGLLQVSVAEKQVAKLTEALLCIQSSELQIQIEKSNTAVVDAQQTDLNHGESGKEKTLKLEVLGQDRPGIVEDITHELVSLGVNIEEMLSEQRLASMSNELLFYAELTMRLPTAIEPGDVQAKLEAMSDQLMVDLSFS